jgi:hypothetical protein
LHPHPFLCEGQGHDFAGTETLDPRLGDGRALLRIDFGRHLVKYRRLKDSPERKLHMELIANPSHQPHGEQRMAAELEEVVVAAGRPDGKKLGP